MARKDGTGTKPVGQLVAELRASGFRVQKIGSKWMVYNDAGESYPLPAKLSHGSMYDNAMAKLRRLGFDPDQALINAETDRLERLAKDRAKGDAALAEAEQRAKAAPTREPFKVAPARVEPEPEPARITGSEFDAESVRKVLASIPRSTEVVDMTALHALELLLANRWYDPDTQVESFVRSNRPFIDATAQKYADLMTSGQWVDHHQGIGVDTDGWLTDGQHRLAAVVKADEKIKGIKVPMQITYGLPPESVDVVDQGMRRGVAGVLGTRGKSNTTNLAAATKLVMFYDGQRSVSEWTRFTPTALELLHAIDALPGIEAHVGQARGFGAFAIPSSVAAARLVLARDSSERRVEEFFTKLRTGLDMAVDNPIYVLREGLIRQRDNAKRKRNSLEQFAMIIKAWNAWAEGRKAKQVAWRNTEAVPRAVRMA